MFKDPRPFLSSPLPYTGTDPIFLLKSCKLWDTYIGIHAVNFL